MTRDHSEKGLQHANSKGEKYLLEHDLNLPQTSTVNARCAARYGKYTSSTYEAAEYDEL
jgi:hypothetical protein